MAEESSPEVNFIAAMKEERERLGIGQAELAKRLQAAGIDHMHPTTISRIESGDRSVRLDEAFAIANALDLDVQRMTESHSLLTDVIALAQVAHDRVDEVESATRLAYVAFDELDLGIRALRGWAAERSNPQGPDRDGAVAALGIRLSLEHAARTPEEAWDEGRFLALRQIQRDNPKGRLVTAEEWRDFRSSLQGELSTGGSGAHSRQDVRGADHAE